MSVISSGYKLEWDDPSKPASPCVLPNHASVYLEKEFTSRTIAEGLASGAMRVMDRSRLTCIVPLGVACNAKGKLRLIWDGRHINSFLKRQKFQIEQLHKQGRSIFAGCAFGSILDISSAYHHVDIHEDFWQFLGFQWESTTYCFCSLPFGLSLAPKVWTAVTKPVVKYWRSARNFRVLPYMDDFPNAETSWESARAQAQLMFHHLQYLGFVVNADKCVGLHNPLQEIPALGFSINLKLQIFLCPTEKLLCIINRAQKILSSRHAKARILASLAGLIISVWLALGPVVRQRTRSMLANLQDRLKPGEDSLNKASWDRYIRLSHDTKQELRFWASAHPDQFPGRPIANDSPPNLAEIDAGSDASASGWGGWVQITSSTPVRNKAMILQNIQQLAPAGASVREAHRKLQDGIEVFGRFTPEQRDKSSTWRELFTVLMFCRTLGPLLKGGRYRIQLDNAAAVCGLGGKIPLGKDKEFSLKVHGGSKKPDIQALIIEILDTCMEHDFELLPVWVPRELNERADALSHANEEDVDGYTLSRKAFSRLDKDWGPFTIDRFAEPGNCLVSSGRFNSQFWQEGCEWPDAMSLLWGENENNWIHPPYSMLHDVVSLVINQRVSGTLIVPEWRGTSWFSRLFFSSSRTSKPIQELQRAAFITEMRVLGFSSRLLDFPCIDPSERDAFCSRHCPFGNLLALRIRF